MRVDAAQMHCFLPEATIQYPRSKEWAMKGNVGKKRTNEQQPINNQPTTTNNSTSTPEEKNAD